MHINQSTTAIESYHTSGDVVETINDKVLNSIKHLGVCSNNDIQRHTGLTSRQVGCARWHLIKSNKIIITGTKHDELTNRDVETVSINMQPELFTEWPKSKIERIKDLCLKDIDNTLAHEILEIIK